MHGTCIKIKKQYYVLRNGLDKPKIHYNTKLCPSFRSYISAACLKRKKGIKETCLTLSVRNAPIKMCKLTLQSEADQTEFLIDSK